MFWWIELEWKIYVYKTSIGIKTNPRRRCTWFAYLERREVKIVNVKYKTLYNIQYACSSSPTKLLSYVHSQINVIYTEFVKASDSVDRSDHGRGDDPMLILLNGCYFDLFHSISMIENNWLQINSVLSYSFHPHQPMSSQSLIFKYYNTTIYFIISSPPTRRNCRLY